MKLVDLVSDITVSVFAFIGLSGGKETFTGVRNSPGSSG